MRRTIEKLVFKKVFLCAFCDWTPVLGGAQTKIGKFTVQSVF